MAHVSYPFKKINKSIFQKPASIDTEDSRYWQQLGSPVLVKEFGAIDYLDFSPVEPHYFAATCSVRVQIYDPITKVVTKNISKFVEAAYGATFRDDGRLLITGSEEAVVKLFDVHSKNVLRIFSGHTGPVHRTFFTKDQTKVMSFSDDKSVCLWDIATEEKLANFTEHADYVRAGAPSPVSPELILSGGYDHMVKLYDCRSNETVLCVNHGSPVESTLFLPSGGIFISAGGTEIKVWDIFNAGKLLANISQHHKTVTTLRLASNNSRLMSASLDRHVKIYDISTFKVVHNIDFPNAVLSMAISNQDDTLAVGMIDGVISIRKRETPSPMFTHKRRLFKFAPDHVHKQNSTSRRTKKKYNSVHSIDIDGLLRRMQYGKALTYVVKSKECLKYPEEAAALIQEMLRRKVLHIAMNTLKENAIGYLLKYFQKHIGETRVTRTIIDAINVFIDVFDSQVRFFSEENLMLYKKLTKIVKDEIYICNQISELEGAISLLLAAAQVGTTTPLELNENITPSFKAQKELVIHI